MLSVYRMITGDKVPRYKYRCSHCSHEWWEWLGIKDPSPEKCLKCETLEPIKVPTNFVTKTVKKEETKTAKENVIDHIEENRQILKQMKTQSKEESK
jgi:hypothetical protein